jgi:PQQ-dependent catabolism-associated CXXCW motif protein
LSVQGDTRTGILRINEIAQESEGEYLLRATLGWAEGEQRTARVELILKNQAISLVFRSAAGMVAVSQSKSGDFAGTLRSEAKEMTARMERLTEAQVDEKVKEAVRRAAERTFANEDKDWGVAPTAHLRTERIHAPTPISLPGARVVRTLELRQMLRSAVPPIAIDVLDGNFSRTIPGAIWLDYAGHGVLGNSGDSKFETDMGKISKGNKTAPIVFFCFNSECWLSYNAGLRALNLGYTSVYWFRGGITAWQRAGFDTMEKQPYTP